MVEPGQSQLLVLARLNDVHPVLNGLAGGFKFGGHQGDVELALVNFGDHLAHGKLVLLHTQLIQR